MPLRRRSGAADSILLVGAYGQRNPGDEALLSAFVRALPGYDLVVASSDPEQTAQLHGVRAISARSWREVMRGVHETAAVVFGGGTVFKTLPASVQRRPLALLGSALALAGYARAHGRMVLQVGVGVGRLDTPAAAVLARRVAALADLLILRDDESARMLATTGIPAPLRVGADPAWTLLDEVPTRVSSDDRIVVVPSRWAVNENPAHLPALAAALAPLVRTGTRVEVQPWQIGGAGGLDDRDHALRLAALLGGRAAVVASPPDLVSAAHELAGARLVISGRLHGVIAAAAAGVRTLAVANEPKQWALATRLGLRAPTTSAPAEELTEEVAAALSSPPPSAASVRAEIAAAEEGFGLLRLMLADGREPAEGVSGLRLEPIG